jgi:hypothetical protein
MVKEAPNYADARRPHLPNGVAAMQQQRLLVIGDGTFLFPCLRQGTGRGVWGGWVRIIPVRWILRSRILSIANSKIRSNSSSFAKQFSHLELLPNAGICRWLKDVASEWLAHLKSMYD